METNNLPSLEDYKKVAIKVKTRVENELPILEDVLGAINSSKENIQLLPQVVHTVAVTSHAKSYLFLEDAYTIYNAFIKQGKVDTINHDLWKSIKKTHSVIEKLYKQECDEYARQMEYFTLEVQKRKVENPDIDEVKELEIEVQHFSHVECDISSALKSVIFILIVGYIPTEEQVNAMRNMLKKAKTIITEQIAIHKRSLKTCEDILNAAK
jgi:DNA polymerase III psi subunit